MKRTRLRRRAPLRAKKPLRRSAPIRRTPAMAASAAQRAAVAGRRCIVCGTDRRIDPAHLIPRSLGGCGDAACCVPLCRRSPSAPTTPASSTCSRIWSRRGGRSSRTPSGTWG